jgi:hypothetical protein
VICSLKVQKKLSKEVVVVVAAAVGCQQLLHLKLVVVAVVVGYQQLVCPVVLKLRMI